MEPDSVSLDTKLDEEIKEQVEEVKEAIADLKDENGTEDRIAEKVASILRPYIDLALKKQEDNLDNKLADLTTDEAPTEEIQEEPEAETPPTNEEENEEESYDVKPRRSHKLFYRPMRKDEQ
jgi:hypothetical protein